MNHFSPQIATPLAASRADEFRMLCLEYAACVQTAGVTVTPFADSSLPLFCSLPSDLQQKVLQSIRADIEIFNSMTGENFSLRDSAHHLWRYLRSIKATPDSDLFDKIGAGDLVEMYMMDGARYAQVFRNLRVLECVSFTLEQMFGMDWRFGVYRKPEDEALMSDYARQLLDGTIAKTVALSHPAQIVQELDSVKRYTFSLRTKYLSPVRTNGHVVALICVHDCQTIGQLT